MDLKGYHLIPSTPLYQIDANTIYISVTCLRNFENHTLKIFTKVVHVNVTFQSMNIC